MVVLVLVLDAMTEVHHWHDSYGWEKGSGHDNGSGSHDDDGL